MLTVWTVLQGIFVVAAAVAVWALLVAIVANWVEQRRRGHPGSHTSRHHGTVRHRFMW